jgi:hypothetical protein
MLIIIIVASLVFATALNLTIGVSMRVQWKGKTGRVALGLGSEYLVT